VKNGINKGFLNSLVWVAVEPVSFSPAGDFDDLFLNDHCPYIRKGFAYLVLNRTFESFFGKVVRAFSFGRPKIHHVNLSVREELFWVFAEHQKSDVSDIYACISRIGNFERKQRIFNCPRVDTARKGAFAISEVVLKVSSANIINFRISIDPVVKGYRIKLVIKLKHLRTFSGSLDARRLYPILKLLLFVVNIYGSLIRTGVSTAAPKINQMFALILNKFDLRCIAGSNQPTILDQLLLYFVKRVSRQSFRR
jgi:hypothetical protein